MAKFKKFFILVFLLAPQLAFSWGFVGHRATAYIAEANLNDNAKDAVKEILGDTRLADAAVWADAVRKSPEYAKTQRYHFGNIPESFPEGEALIAKNILQAPDRQPGVLEAIIQSKEVLADPSKTKADKEAALKFLVHFIGDLHQPLHTGYDKDRGGNTVHFQWFGKDTNLHSVWDSEIIYQSKAHLLKDLGEKTDPGFVYAKAISAAYQKPVKKLGSLLVWYQESLDVVPVTYKGYDQADPKVYIDQNEEIVDIRVRLAGLRIADTLNKIFDSSKAQFSSFLTKREMKHFFGDVDGLVQLGPRQK